MCVQKKDARGDFGVAGDGENAVVLWRVGGLLMLSIHSRLSVARCGTPLEQHMPVLHSRDFVGGIAAFDAFEQYAECRTSAGIGLMFYRCQAHMRDARGGKEASSVIRLKS